MSNTRAERFYLVCTYFEKGRWPARLMYMWRGVKVGNGIRPRKGGWWREHAFFYVDTKATAGHLLDAFRCKFEHQQHEFQFKVMADTDFDSATRVLVDENVDKLRGEVKTRKNPRKMVPLGCFCDLAERWHRRLKSHVPEERERAEPQPEQPDAEPERRPTAAGGEQSLGKEARALAVLAEHPDWSDEAIAKAAGCHRTTLYRWPKFRFAREKSKEGRSDLPAGSKDADGNLEAWG